MDEDTLYQKYSNLKNRDYHKDLHDLIWPMGKHIGATLRRFTNRHDMSDWVPSALIDRVDRLEALVGNIRGSHPSRIFTGNPIRSHLRHNQKSVVTTVAAAAVLGAVVYSFVTYRRKKEESDWE